MSILYCRSCGVDVSGEPLFRQVTFAIEKGEKVGLVGPNGAGKTTLIRACLGEHPIEEGEVILTAEVGYLPQKPFLEEEGTVWESMLEEQKELIQMREQLRFLEERMAHSPKEKIFEQYGNLTEEYERQGGYALEAQIRRILSGLGLEDVAQTRVEHLSGGQKTRLALSKLLLRSPELLVLDEPTNHLDLEALEWLEGFLRGYDGSILVVSHDRYFLDNIVEKILHLSHGELKTYNGNYSEYELQRAVEEVTLSREAERLNKKIARLEEYIRRNKAGVNAKQARGRETQLKKLKPIEMKNSTRDIKISLATERRSGDRTLILENVGIKFPQKTLFTDVSMELRRGDRVALLGANGVGKTSLLKAIKGHLPHEGEIRIGANVKLGYYSQEHEELQETGSIMDEIRADSSLLDPEIRSLLARFGFVGEEVFKPVKVLSGGEKSRLALVKLFLAEGNLLLLDEPTNHLDMQMRDVLEEAFQDYTGTLLVVSHDRYFLNRVVNKIAHLTPEGIEIFQGDYSSYKTYVQEEKAREAARIREEEALARASTANSQAIHREEKARQRKISQLEEQIEELEEDLTELAEKLEKAGDDYEKAMELHQEHEEKVTLRDELLEEWMELTEG
ncbi:MAG: ABC-F family ATP-binding cassette domain-containing protein [Desulfitobacterium sp.]|nr:ABC-F family ATP-binding cassette domain-containing protein [Desulfitobacterium sp.]